MPSLRPRLDSPPGIGGHPAATARNLPGKRATVSHQMAARRMLFSRFEVRIEDRQRHGLAWGEPVGPARHHPAVEVKGATDTALRVGRDDDRWFAQAVLNV